MKKFGLITTLLTVASAMTLVSCGGSSAKEKAFVSFLIYGDNAAVFTKTYDGQPAEMPMESINTNSDGEVKITWEQEVENEEHETVVQELESAPVNAGTYLIKVSVAETAKYAAALTSHDYTIAKAPLPESFVTFAADFPESVHFTKTGSGRNVRRTAVEADVAAIKEKITVNDGSSAWVIDTDYTVTVNVSSDTAASVVINSLKNPNYSSLSHAMVAELAS